MCWRSNLVQKDIADIADIQVKWIYKICICRQHIYPCPSEENGRPFQYPCLENLASPLCCSPDWRGGLSRKLGPLVVCVFQGSRSCPACRPESPCTRFLGLLQTQWLTMSMRSLTALDIQSSRIVSLGQDQCMYRLEALQENWSPSLSSF